LESSIHDSTADNGIFCTLSIPDFFIIQLGKVFPGCRDTNFRAGECNLGKYCGKLAEGRKYPGNVAEDSLITKVSNI
jgi:hypothetical protein